jgi:hypothetical protein
MTKPIIWVDAMLVTTEAKPLEFVLAARCLLSDVRGDYEATKAALLAILRWRAELGWEPNEIEPTGFYERVYRGLIPRERKRRP